MPCPALPHIRDRALQWAGRSLGSLGSLGPFYSVTTPPCSLVLCDREAGKKKKQTLVLPPSSSTLELAGFGLGQTFLEGSSCVSSRDHCVPQRQPTTWITTLPCMALAVVFRMLVAKSHTLVLGFKTAILRSLPFLLH